MLKLSAQVIQNPLQALGTCSHILRETQIIKTRTLSILPGCWNCTRTRRERESQRCSSRGAGGMECVSRAATTESLLRLAQRVSREVRRLAPDLTCPTPLKTRSLHNSISLGIGRKGRMRINSDIGSLRIPQDFLDESYFTLSNWRPIDDWPPLSLKTWLCTHLPRLNSLLCTMVDTVTVHSCWKSGFSARCVPRWPCCAE